MKHTTTCCLLIFTLFVSRQTIAQHTFTIQVNKPVATIQPTMWGIFLKILTWAPMAAFTQRW